MTKKRMMIAVVAIAVLGVGLILGSGAAADRGTADGLLTTAAARGNLIEKVSGSGAVRANQSVELIWETSGVVETTQVSIGQLVRANDELARLEKQSLPKSILLAEADYYNGLKTLDHVKQSTTAQAQALVNLNDSEKKLQTASQRSDGLNYPRATKDEIDDAYDEYVTYDQLYLNAKEKYESMFYWAVDHPDRVQAFTNMNSLRNTRDQKYERWYWLKSKPDELEVGEKQAATLYQQAVLKDAQREWQRVEAGPTAVDIANAQTRVDAALAVMNRARITAPFDGVITRIDSQTGDQVRAGQSAFRMDDLDRLLIDVNVSEIYINRVQLGQSANIQLDAFPRQNFTGEVIEIAQTGDNHQGEVHFKVTVVLNDTPDMVLPGMSATIYIAVSEIQNALLVPSSAVQENGDAKTVLVNQNGALQTVRVRTGASSETMTEIIGGELKEGDAVVVFPPSDGLGNPRLMMGQQGDNNNPPNPFR